jgi:hypothetical protein
MRLNAMETMQRRAPDIGDISEAEREEIKVEEYVTEDAAKDRLLKFVSRIGVREKIELLMYEGNLEVEELLVWVHAMDKYFDYEDIEEEKMVKHVVTILKGHATLWWDEM